MNPRQVKITALWDEEAEVWVAESDDVPGLVAEAPSIPALIKRLQVLIPELLDENGYPDGEDVPFEIDAIVRGIAHREMA